MNAPRRVLLTFSFWSFPASLGWIKGVPLSRPTQYSSDSGRRQIWGEARGIASPRAPEMGRRGRRLEEPVTLSDSEGSVPGVGGRSGCFTSFSMTERGGPVITCELSPPCSPPSLLWCFSSLGEVVALPCPIGCAERSWRLGRRGTRPGDPLRWTLA